MSSKFIAAVVATALTITSFGASQVNAQQYRRNNNAEAALGIAALVAMGLLIANNKKDRKTQSSTRGHAKQQYKRPKAHRTQPRPVPQRVARYTLPERCLRHVDTPRGTRKVMAERCLEKHYSYAHSLPQYCVTRFENQRGRIRYGYRLRCLKKDGYRISRH